MDVANAFIQMLEVGQVRPVRGGEGFAHVFCLAQQRAADMVEFLFREGVDNLAERLCIHKLEAVHRLPHPKVRLHIFAIGEMVDVGGADETRSFRCRG